MVNIFIEKLQCSMIMFFETQVKNVKINELLSIAANFRRFVLYVWSQEYICEARQ